MDIDSALDQGKTGASAKNERVEVSLRGVKDEKIIIVEGAISETAEEEVDSAITFGVG